MAAAADFQVVRRLGQTQIHEEGIRHIGVVVLSRMYDKGGAPGIFH